MSRLQFAIPILTIALLAACGDDPSPEGTWRQIPSSFEADLPVEERALVTFDEDGTYSVRENGTLETGTWTATDREVTIVGAPTPDPGVEVTVGYVATDEQLMLGALFPVGSVDGTVGTWRRESRYAGSTVSLELELRDDNTAVWDRRGPDGDELLDGTWRYELADVVFSTTIDGITINVHFQEMPGVALGGLYERVAEASRSRTSARPGRAVVDALAPPPRLTGR